MSTRLWLCRWDCAMHSLSPLNSVNAFPFALHLLNAIYGNYFSFTENLRQRWLRRRCFCCDSRKYSNKRRHLNCLWIYETNPTATVLHSSFACCQRIKHRYRMNVPVVNTIVFCPADEWLTLLFTWINFFSPNLLQTKRKNLIGNIILFFSQRIAQ